MHAFTSNYIIFLCYNVINRKTKLCSKIDQGTQILRSSSLSVTFLSILKKCSLKCYIVEFMHVLQVVFQFLNLPNFFEHIFESERIFDSKKVSLLSLLLFKMVLFNWEKSSWQFASSHKFFTVEVFETMIWKDARRLILYIF